MRDEVLVELGSLEAELVLLGREREVQIGRGIAGTHVGVRERLTPLRGLPARLGDRIVEIERRATPCAQVAARQDLVPAALAALGLDDRLRRAIHHRPCPQVAEIRRLVVRILVHPRLQGRRHDLLITPLPDRACRQIVEPRIVDRCRGARIGAFLHRGSRVGVFEHDVALGRSGRSGCRWGSRSGVRDGRGRGGGRGCGGRRGGFGRGGRTLPAARGRDDQGGEEHRREASDRGSEHCRVGGSSKMRGKSSPSHSGGCGSTNRDPAPPPPPTAGKVAACSSWLTLTWAWALTSRLTATATWTETAQR